MITKFKLFENWDNNDIIGSKVGDIVISNDSNDFLKLDKRYEIIEIFDYVDEEKDYIIKDEKDLITVKDAETNETFWVVNTANKKQMRKFYAWRFTPELIYNAKKYNL